MPHEPIVSKVLPVKEILAMRPQDRKRYVGHIIREIVQLNQCGVTISEVSRVTGLQRNDVMKHLDHLVVTRQATCLTRGTGRIYYPLDKVLAEVEYRDKNVENRFYRIHRIQDDGQTYIVVQEIEVDETRSLVVKGGILVPSELMLGLMSSIQKLGLAEAIQE